jgi:hypothetical protein
VSRFGPQIGALAPNHAVERAGADGSPERIAEGYELAVPLSAEIDGQTITWTERRFLVRSLSLAKASEQAVQRRLARAQSAVAQLLAPRRGKPRLTERAQIEQAVADLLADARVERLLDVTVQETVTEHPVRAYRERAASVRQVRTVTLLSQVNALALEQALAQLGWRVYATNHDAAHLALVMLAYSFLMLYRLTLPLPPEEAFSPSVTRSSLPSVHRQMLLWLFQDLVLWLLQTEQIQTFRPRRN